MKSVHIYNIYDKFIHIISLYGFLRVNSLNLQKKTTTSGVREKERKSSSQSVAVYTVTLLFKKAEATNAPRGDFWFIQGQKISRRKAAEISYAWMID